MCRMGSPILYVSCQHGVNRLGFLFVWKQTHTSHSSWSVHTREPAFMISSEWKKVKDALVAITSTFTLSYWV